MTGVATAIGVGVAGIAAGAYESSQASSDQQAAAQSAQNTQLGMYNQTNANLAPFRTTGADATARLAGLMGVGPNAMTNAQVSSYLTNLPGYQFQMQQGTQAIDRSAASQGLLNSGATGKALQQYGQGLGSNYFGQYLNQLQFLSNQGENAAAQTGQFAQQTGAGVAGSQIYGGNAAAAGAIGTGNSITNGINQGVGLYGLYQGGYFGNGGGAGINAGNGYGSVMDMGFGE